MKALTVMASIVIATTCQAAEWDGLLMGQKLGAEVVIPATSEKNEWGLPIVPFEPTKQFLTFTAYSVWASPISKRVVGIIAGSDFDGDASEAKLFRQKVANLLKTKFPESVGKVDDDGDWTLTMKNGDFITIEGDENYTAIRAVRKIQLQCAIEEAKKAALKDAGVAKGTKWTGELFGKKLGDSAAVPDGAEKCEYGLPIATFSPQQKIFGEGDYGVWVTPISKKIASIAAMINAGEDESDAKLKRRNIALILKAKFPEGIAKEDEDGDWSITMKNGDVIGVELRDTNVLVQALRPLLIQLGKTEFDKKSVSDAKADLDAL